MDPPKSPKSPVRFSSTPPDSPKSCMKGSRKIAFEEKEPSSSSMHSHSSGGGVRGQGQSTEFGGSDSPRPKRSTKKAVVIRSPDGGGGEESGGGGSSQPQNVVTVEAVKMGEIEFKFQLSQHYEQKTPPPNCTSNGAHEKASAAEESSGSGEKKRKTSFRFEDSVDGSESQKEGFYDLMSMDINDPIVKEMLNDFIDEIIENASVEAANRQKAQAEAESAATRFSASARELLGRSATNINNIRRRAHGTITNWISKICVKAQNTIRT